MLLQPGAGEDLGVVKEFWSVRLTESVSLTDRHRGDMKTNLVSTNRTGPDGCQHALRRDGSFWHLTFEGRQATFEHELGALYVAYLLLEPPREPIHGVALALKARKAFSGVEADEALPERAMGLEEEAAVRALWRRQRELERVLEERLEIEPVKAEAQREWEEITEHLRQSPWLSRQGAERCARAVAVAIQRLHDHLATAVDVEGRPAEVLRAFARHLLTHLLTPSGRGGANDRDLAWAPVGCFIYVPPAAAKWIVQSPQSKVQSAESKVLSPESTVSRRPAAVDYLARFLCAGFALVLLATGCAGPRPLKGGRAVTTRKPEGIVEQTLQQGENPAQPTKQTQETVKVRTYTVPAGSRMEQSQSPAAAPTRRSTLNTQPITVPPSTLNHSSTIASAAVDQPSTVLILSAPMPVVEREEIRAGTELGAAQKDTARELGAKLSSLKGIVWVGVGLFVFGLASLVYPPLKVVIGSVTTSAALLLGGLALMVLPSLIVGNELLILGGVAIVVGGWFLAHRHGQLSGLVAASSGAQSIALPATIQNDAPRPSPVPASGTPPATGH